MYKLPILTIIVICFIFARQGTADEPTVYQLSKAALHCLYTQSQSLLEEPADPVVVLLSENCSQPDAGQTLPTAAGERYPLPPPPKLDAEAESAGQVLFLTQKQLRCFRQRFETLSQQEDNPMAVVFSENCPEASHE